MNTFDYFLLLKKPSKCQREGADTLFFFVHVRVRVRTRVRVRVVYAPLVRARTLVLVPGFP